jgi:hypothetical protein
LRSAFTALPPGAQSISIMSEEKIAARNGAAPPPYLNTLIAAVNDGAKAAQAGALLFLLVGLYLLATAFGVSDEDLLVGRAVTISQIGAALPVGADLSGAKYSATTTFPANFDPTKAKMVLTPD